MERFKKCKARYTVDQNSFLTPEGWADVAFGDDGHITISYTETIQPGRVSHEEFWHGQENPAKKGDFALVLVDKNGRKLSTTAVLVREGNKLTGRYQNSGGGNSGDWHITLGLNI
jgi:uncharacterized protein YndB with AHSA1/START domain